MHGRGYLSLLGVSGGPSDGETDEVPVFYLFDGNNGWMMATNSGFFTQLASIYEGNG